MATPNTWLEVLAWVKAIFESPKSGLDALDAYRKYRSDRETLAESQRVALAFSTYSEEEVSSIATRLQEYRNRFIAERSGTQRARCLCSVLNDLKEGNGGVLPFIDDWERIYQQLKCGRR